MASADQFADLRIPAVLVALDRERLFLHQTFRIEVSATESPCCAFLCSHEQQRILVVETGVGIERTRRAVDWLLSRPKLDGAVVDPSLLLYAGFAGALQATMRVGDVILAHEVLDMAGSVWCATAPTASSAAAHVGRLLTASRFIGEPAEKLALGLKHRALAVDMESAAFAQRCTERSVPWACLRVVSDDVSVPFTSEVAGLVEDGKVKLGRVMWLLLHKPWLLPKLLRLERQTRVAARRLADAVIQFLACSSAG